MFYKIVKFLKIGDVLIKLSYFENGILGWRLIDLVLLKKWEYDCVLLKVW